MNELAESVALTQAGKIDAARALIRSDRGRQAMDGLRRVVAELEDVERAGLAASQEAWDASVGYSSTVSGPGRWHWSS